MDLGANEWTTFWKVTFPLILPGILAAALLAFSLSIDDYVITNFMSGQTKTFPLCIYGSSATACRSRSTSSARSSSWPRSAGAVSTTPLAAPVCAARDRSQARDAGA